MVGISFVALLWTFSISLVCLRGGQPLTWIRAVKSDFKTFDVSLGDAIKIAEDRKGYDELVCRVMAKSSIRRIDKTGRRSDDDDKIYDCFEGTSDLLVLLFSTLVNDNLNCVTLYINDQLPTLFQNLLDFFYRYHSSESEILGGISSAIARSAI